MQNAAYYRKKAERVRQLARFSSDSIYDEMMQLAKDFDELADDLLHGAVELRHPELMPQSTYTTAPKTPRRLEINSRLTLGARSLRPPSGWYSQPSWATILAGFHPRNQPVATVQLDRGAALATLAHRLGLSLGCLIVRGVEDLARCHDGVSTVEQVTAIDCHRRIVSGVSPPELRSTPRHRLE